jgi:sterol desaturase/sphingolipid hydroxylase (fatty acid hydroxylase superfamily)
LRVLIGAPELHHWHHDRDRDAGNYANISPLMDILFGTYRCPDHEPKSFGLREPISRNYLGQMLHPFLPRRKVAQAFGENNDGGEEARLPLLLPSPSGLYTGEE